MEFNSLLISTIIFLSSFTSSINSQDLTNEVKECFVNLLVLHYPKGRLVMAGTKFVYPKTSFPPLEEMRTLLTLNDRQRLEELSKCLQLEEPTGWGLLFNSNLSTAMEIYEKMLDINGNETFPILEELQAQFHNAQCFMDLMVREGKQKMGSPDFFIPQFEHSLITELLAGRIKVSPDGKAVLIGCILSDKRMAITVNEHDVLHLHDPNIHDFLVAVSRIPYSTKLLEEIKKECHCLAKMMVEFYNASTSLVISHGRVFRAIGTMIDTEEKIYDKKHGKMFAEHKKCIYRKVPFLKRETNCQLGEHSIDIGAIFSHGIIVVPDAFKQQLDKQSDCLMEFLYAKLGWKHFSKVLFEKSADKKMIHFVYKPYIFHEDAKEFLLRLDNSKEMLDLVENGLLKIAEGTKEFAALKECGVVNVRHDAQGKELFNIEWLLALYTPTEWFTRKIITTRFTKKEMANKEHGEGTSTNIVADQHLKEDGHTHEECSICLDTSEFTEGVKLPCNHYYHRKCISGWMESMNATCPLDRLAIVPSKEVDYEADRIIPQE